MSGLRVERSAGAAAAGINPQPAVPQWRRFTGSEWVVVALLLAAASALFVTGLGFGTLWDQDEAKYAQVAREILQTRDAITLHVNGAPWFVHPPLYLWLQAITGWAFGFSEFTARIWSAVFGVVGVLATYLLGRMLFSSRTGWLAAIVLMTMFQYFAQARLAIFDIVLVAFMLLAFYTFLHSTRDGSATGRRVDPRRAVWAFVWAGLGTLTKGPIGLLLPGMAAAAFLALRRGRYRWREVPWVKGAIVYAAIALPWYLAEWVRHGWPFVQTVIGYYTLNRFFGVVEGQAGPWWYYAPVFGLGAFPWTAFLVAMVPYHARRLGDDGSLAVLVWTGVTVIFYTLAGTKLPNYVLPAYPMAALGIAALWDRLFTGEERARRYINVAFVFTVVALLLFAGEVGVFARLKYPEEFAALQRHLVIVTLGLAAWLVLATAAYALRRAAASFAAVAGTTVLLATMLLIWTLPLVEAQRPIKAVAAAITHELRPGTILVGVNLNAYQTLLYYTNHPVIWVDDSRALLPLLCQPQRAIVVAHTGEFDGVMKSLSMTASPQIRPIIQRGDLTAVLKEGTLDSCRSN